jgi:imidazolonepropionase-like amidohydrolase
MRKKIAECVLGFTLLLAFGACDGEPHPSYPSATSSPPTLKTIPADALVIVNGLVIDGAGADPIPDGIVALRGTHIVAVGHKTDFAIPSEVDIIDAKGGTILPGIIDAHTHLTDNPTTRRFSFLLEGVTATCDLGAPLESMPQFEQDDTTGPSARGFHAGPIITAPGGYPDAEGRGHHINYEVANPEEARAAVADLIQRGADVIKIVLEPGPIGVSWPVLSPQEVKAIVEEGHARGRLVRAHVTRADLLNVALDAGVDAIEHIPIPQLSEADWKVATDDKDHLKLPADYEAQLVRMVKQRVVMVPTLSVTPVICDMDWYGTPPEYQPLCSELFLEVVRRFHDLGGTVALGNDYGTWRVELGMPLPEMRLLLAAGLTRMEVIEASTRNAARVCGHGNELGTLEPGKLADVIIVDGDPLVDIEAMSQVLLVIKGGQIAFPVPAVTN